MTTQDLITLLTRNCTILPGGVEELTKLLNKSQETHVPLKIKFGMDPTRPDLHLGHTVVLRKLKMFQDMGHKIIIIIGVATAMIGDPTGRSETRPSLTREEVDKNATTYLNQLSKIIDLSHNVEIVDNSQWLHPLNLTAICQLCSHVTVAQMLARDDFSKRYSTGQPIAVHEFLYPLMQAYDSVALEADIEFGGTDQMFNLLLAREIQTAYGLKTQQLAFMVPLIEGTDGKIKMSKTYPDNCISITDAPDVMFGKIMSVSDDLMMRYYSYLTDISDKELNNYRQDIAQGANPMFYKKQLAKTLITYYHSETEAQEAEINFTKQFSNKEIPEQIQVESIQNGESLIDVLVHYKLLSSKTEAKRMIQGGGVRLNGDKVLDPNSFLDFTHYAEAIVQVGKRKFIKLTER